MTPLMTEASAGQQLNIPHVTCANALNPGAWDILSGLAHDSDSSDCILGGSSIQQRVHCGRDKKQQLVRQHAINKPHSWHSP
jgi:hypothetical protein